jgi:hypothetical protein
MSGGAEPLERQVILNDFYRAKKCSNVLCPTMPRREGRPLAFFAGFHGLYMNL